MFCSKCGNKSPSGARFCQKCGASIGNNNESANLLDHPTSLAALGEDSDSRAESPVVADHGKQAAKQEDSANFMSYNVVPKRAADIARPTGHQRHRKHMAAPTQSADMDYTFYPGQSAEPSNEELASKDKNNTDPLDYPIQPVFPKLAKPVVVQRVISDTNHTRLHTSPVAPGLPAPKPTASDVTNFTGYQILPAAYKPTEQRPQPIEHEYIQIPQPQAEPIVSAPPPQPMHEQHVQPTQPQHIPLAEPVPPQLVHVQVQQPQHIPAQPQQPQPIPTQPQQPQPMHVQPQQSQPIHVQPQQPQPMHVQPQQPQPMHVQPQPPQHVPVQPQLQAPQPKQQMPVRRQQPQPVPTMPLAEYDQAQQQAMWQMHEEPEMATHLPRKKSKIPTVIGILVVLILLAGTGFFVYNMIRNVNPDHLVGTWEQSPPLGTWIPRFDFREDGTGMFYQFNTDHNVSRYEVAFAWSIESGNMMRNSLWPDLAEVSFDRGARPPRFRYKFEGSDDWQSFVRVVDPDN